MRVLPAAVCYLVACGILAGVLIAALVPIGLREPHLHTQDFRLSRKADERVEITEARWFFVPQLFGDFDLQLSVELSDGADLDLLLRQVQPRVVDQQLEPFAGRFSALRLSTVGDGSGWRTREQVLFGPRHGGVGLAPGHAATVWVEARGRMLRANVAGRWQPWFEAADEYGMTTVIVKGGNAVLHDFVLQNLGQPRRWLWSWVTWSALGALGALLVAAIANAVGERAAWFFTVGPCLPLLAWLTWSGADLQLAWPSPAAMLLLLAGTCVAALAGLRRVRVRLCGGLLAVAAAMLLVGMEWLRHESAAVDAAFGPRAGSALSEAHGQLVRGPGGLHDVRGPRPCVFLLGGQLLYDRGEPSDHLELQLGRELRARGKKVVDVPCLPTVDGHSQQQWRAFSTWFTGYRPDVLVFGVPRDEAAVDPATGRPRSDPRALLATVRAAQKHCGAAGARLVVFTEAELPHELMLVLRQVEAEGVPLVVAASGATPKEIASRLGAAILPLLE